MAEKIPDGVEPLWIIVRHVHDCQYRAGAVITNSFKEQMVEDGTLDEDDVAKADGRTIDRKTYPHMADVVRDAFGIVTEDDAEKVKLPDLRGHFHPA